MRFSRNGSGWCALAVIATGAYSAHAGELVVNGGFETGSFFPWIAPPFNPPQSVCWVSAGGGHSGTYFARLSSTNLEWMSQVLPTTAGSDYELSFWVRRTGIISDPFRVRWEGQLVYSQFMMNLDYMEWQNITIPLHSNITGSLLEFGQDYFPQEYHIDDISVVPVPAPSAAPLLCLGGLITFRRNRRAT